ncbi:MAG: nickel pincer cofactor biosynthesis protein LarC [Eubacterium sp.]|nr:nickel pincer cofactor biosynthesis protein LarC [Eubacterium sp.]
MKTLYFDCSSGISGNMVLGALTEIIGDENYLIDELKKLNADGYAIKISKSVKNGITGTHVNVIVDGRDEYGHVHHLSDHAHMHTHKHKQSHEHIHEHKQSHEHNHDHSHESSHVHSHVHRNLHDIESLINNSSLNDQIRDLAMRIFTRVAKAESKVHNKPLSEVHFHEVGAIDSIVDIVGTAILIDRIKPDRIISSIVNDGYGFIECAHGTISVPVPATTEIFADANVKFRQIDVDTELVTPTGAAIIAELSEDFAPMPAMAVDKIGWGAGTKDLKIPNVLKVCVGQEADEKTEEDEEYIVMETNLDDCSGELLGYTLERLFAAGALDVFYTPVFMKKNRPGYLLTVACHKKDMDVLQDIIFRETTTIGIRYRQEKRTRLAREIISIDTPYGRVRAKKVIRGGETYIYPEYESLRKLAEETDLPLKNLYHILENKSK